MNTWSKHSVWPVIACLFIGPLLAAVDLHGEDLGEDYHAQAQARSERQERLSRELIDGLRLSRSQARRLVPIAEEAAALYLEAYEAEARLLPEMLETYGEFAREDSLNRGFTREVERRTGRVHGREIQLRDQTAEQLLALEERAGKVLSSSQRERLSDFPWKQRPAGNRFANRNTRRRPKSAEQLRREAQAQRLREAHEEMRAVHKDRHPHAGPIGRYLLHPFGAERLCKIRGGRTPAIIAEAAEVLRHGTSECPLELVAEQNAELRCVRAQINNWNLINGLHLSEDQIGQIVDLYDQAAAPKWEIVQRDPQSGVPRRALFSLELAVEEVLNAGQRQVLAEYKACLLPPKNLKDPVNVGQASDNSHYERWLERARKLPRAQLTKQINETLKREAEHLGQLSRAERQKRVTLLHRTVRQAAAMPDVEFELNKAELAETIAPPDRVQEVKDKIATLTREAGQPGPIAHFMLKPDFIQQLRTRGQQLAEGVSLEQANLAKGPQAENCEETCAIDGKRTKGKGKKK